MCKPLFALFTQSKAKYSSTSYIESYIAGRWLSPLLNPLLVRKSLHSTFHYLDQSLCTSPACHGFVHANSRLSPARVHFTVSYHFLRWSTNPNISSASALTDNTLHAFSRPGILVLINDADWELEGEASYALQANDNILFVSTLHGG
jgi:hypothetical protein